VYPFYSSSTLSSFAKNSTPSFLPSSPTIFQNMASALGTTSSNVSIRLEDCEVHASGGVTRRLSGSSGDDGEVLLEVGTSGRGDQ
jgi:hypothetical protein